MRPSAPNRLRIVREGGAETGDEVEPGDLNELLQLHHSLLAGMAELRRQDAEAKDRLRASMEAVVGQKIGLRGQADSWVDENGDYVPFPDWDLPREQPTIPFGQYEVVKVVEFGEADDRCPGVMVVVPELGARQKVIIELEYLSFEPETAGTPDAS